MRTGLSLEGKNMVLPMNNFVHQSQEQLNSNFDDHPPAQERSMNQRRPLRSPIDQQAMKNMAASQQSLDQTGQQFYAQPGSTQMKLNLPQGLHRSFVEISNATTRQVNLSSTNSQGPRSGSHGPATIAANSTQPSL